MAYNITFILFWLETSHNWGWLNLLVDLISMVWKLEGFQVESGLIFVYISLKFSMKNELSFWKEYLWQTLLSLIEISIELPVHAKKGDNSESYKATKFWYWRIGKMFHALNLLQVNIVLLISLPFLI